MERKTYIDNLRLLCILLLFPYHAAMAWNCWGEGNYILLGADRSISSFVVALSPWYMALLFLLAGMSTKYSLAKRSLKQYVKERSFKLLLPLFAGTLVVMPVMAYISDKANFGYAKGFFAHYAVFFGKWTDFSGYDGGFGIGHLWFLLYLYVISILSIAILQLQKRYMPTIKTKNATAFLVTILCLAALLFMPVKLGGKSILTYWLFYLFGYYLFTEEILLKKLQKFKYLYLTLFLLSTYFNVYLFLWSNSNHTFLNTLANCFSGVFGILTAITFGKKYLDKSNKISSYLVSYSFLIYIFHFMWVVLFQYFFSKIIVNNGILLLVSVIGAFMATLLTCKIVKLF